MNMFTRTLLCSSLLVCGASAFAQNMSEASMMWYYHGRWCNNVSTKKYR